MTNDTLPVGAKVLIKTPGNTFIGPLMILQSLGQSKYRVYVEAMEELSGIIEILPSSILGSSVTAPITVSTLVPVHPPNTISTTAGNNLPNVVISRKPSVEKIPNSKKRHASNEFFQTLDELAFPTYDVSNN